MSRLVIFNSTETSTPLGTQNYPLSPVMVTPSPSATSFPSGSFADGFPVDSHYPLSSTQSANHVPVGTTSFGPSSTSVSSSSHSQSSSLEPKPVIIALLVVVPLTVFATIFAAIMYYRRRVRRTQQSAIEAMTIVPPSIELPPPIERSRPGSRVLSWLSLPNWRASVGGTTATRPGFKTDVSQESLAISEPKGMVESVGHADYFNSPREVPRYVSGDWRFTKKEDNEKEDRLVLVNGKLVLLRDQQ